MWGLSSDTKDLEIERFQEYEVFAMRWCGSSTSTLGTGCYGPELEDALKRQSVTRRDILSLHGIRGPIKNRIAKAIAALDWGLDYGSTPNNGSIMLNDSTP